MSKVQLNFDDLPVREPEEETRYSVSQIVHQASRLVESSFKEIWVEGEISNLRRPSSGHIYFTMKDAKAQLAVVMFRAAASRLKFALEDGLEVQCRGRLGIYDAQGRFQLTAETARPAGLGALQLAFEQLKVKLEGEGLFDPRHKKKLPEFPTRLAVVTSPTGAALRDILRVMHDRCPVQVIVCPTAVQGSEAPGALVQALARADQLGVDLIIMGRGGGSIEDLWAFNTESVARAIFKARTPIISAVGHEVDVTISDLVADRRAPTPTAAAEMAVPVMAELQTRLQELKARLWRGSQRCFQESALRLERLQGRLGTPTARVNQNRMRLDDAAARLEGVMLRRLRQRRDALVELQARLAPQEPRVRLARSRAVFNDLGARLGVSMSRRVERARGRLEQSMAQLDALSPLAVLARGYSLVVDSQERVVRGLEGLKRGDSLTLRVHQGNIFCTVDKIKKLNDS